MRNWEGLSVLIVEDEAMVSIFLEDALQEMGFDIAGTATTVCEALRIIEARALDAAVLDINLGSGTTREVAVMLRQKGVPFIFQTGYGAAGAPKDFADVPLLAKPFTEEELARTLREVLNPRQ